MRITFRNTSDHHRCRLVLFDVAKYQRYYNRLYNKPIGKYQLSFKFIRNNCQRYFGDNKNSQKWYNTYCIQFGVIGLKKTGMNLIQFNKNANNKKLGLVNFNSNDTFEYRRKLFFDLLNNLSMTDDSKHFDFGDIFDNAILKENNFTKDNVQTKYMYFYHYGAHGGPKSYQYCQGLNENLTSIPGLQFKSKSGIFLNSIINVIINEKSNYAIFGNDCYNLAKFKLDKDFVYWPALACESCNCIASGGREFQVSLVSNYDK